MNVGDLVLYGDLDWREPPWIGVIIRQILGTNSFGDSISVAVVHWNHGQTMSVPQAYLKVINEDR
jgi:hypothetical protein